MLYPDNAKSILGFDKILKWVESRCSSVLGRTAVQAIEWEKNEEKLKSSFKDLGQFLKATSNKQPGFLEMGEIVDTLDLISAKGSVLDPANLLEILNLLNNSFEWKGVLEKEKARHIPGDIDWRQLELLLQTLDNSVSDDGIKDTASPELKKLRKELASQESRIRKSAYKIFDELAAKGLTADGGSVGIRNGRFVIPIRADKKKSIKGYIQDESASGNITFIEPEEVVNNSNILMELRQEEKREVLRILQNLSESTRRLINPLKKLSEWISYVDLLNAKARFLKDENLIIPLFSGNEKPHILKHNFNPILRKLNKIEQKETVPLSLNLDSKNRIIVISGPNAGGKSVALKTAGLTQLMFQHGLPIMAEEGSSLKVFSKLFVDIGDNQSLENDLSTYSSHLILMRKALENASDDCLMLFDEFGSGTEPRIGGAIAEVVLKKINERKAFGVITTHYVNIKDFADKEDGIFNGSMQFDVEKLVPLFKLQMGKPGSSFAIEIARKTGFPESLLDEASEISGVDLMDLEVMLAKVQQQSRDLEEKEKEVNSLKERFKNEQEKYISLKRELDDKRKDILTKAKKEAEWILEGANKEIEKTIRHIKTSKAHKQETKKVREKLEKKKAELKEVEKPAKIINKSVFKIDDRVRVSGYSSTGVIKSIGKKDAEVLVGSLTVRASLEKLELIEESKSSIKQQRAVSKRGIDITSRKASFNNELNIRGMRAEEALVLLEKFLDDALLLGANEIRILHGKGNGILRNLVQSELRKNKSVDSYKEENPDRGGAGITIAFLK